MDGVLNENYNLSEMFLWCDYAVYKNKQVLFLQAEESSKILPSKHCTAWIDGECHDTYDPTRDGTRCVYGYWTAPA